MLPTHTTLSCFFPPTSLDITRGALALVLISFTLPSINSTMSESSEKDLGSSISSLSTCTDLSEASDGDAEQAARHRLCTYEPSGSDDDTVKILTACLDHLPLHGKNLLIHLSQIGSFSISRSTLLLQS